MSAINNKYFARINKGIEIWSRIILTFKVRCSEVDMTQAKLGEGVGTTGQYVNRLIKKGDSIVNKTFVQMLEVLGYDIQLT